MRTKVVHSQSKNAWNVVGTVCGGKYKLARVPYDKQDGADWEMYNTREKAEALEIAMIISRALDREMK